jgi:L-amino acid N-acyltransferase YncA
VIKNIKIRLAAEGDSASILKIYIPFITDTYVSFENEVPALEEFEKRIRNIQKKFPWLVCEINGNIAGYAYASRYRERESYDWSADFSVYVDPEHHGKKIGTALYFSLFELLKIQGYYNIYAGIALPNIKSESLHESFGFKGIGIYHNVGYKLGSWHDVRWYELKIKEHIQSPIKPKDIGEIINTYECKAIFEKAEQMILL